MTCSVYPATTKVLVWRVNVHSSIIGVIPIVNMALDIIDIRWSPRDIQAGEELCIHHGAHDTESSLIQGLPCRCQPENCGGVLNFNFCRDPHFQEKYQHCMTDFTLAKVQQLQRERQRERIEAKTRLSAPLSSWPWPGVCFDDFPLTHCPF